MAIIIQNIDKNLREKGEHLYELRINNQVICEFAHYRENGLSVCLIKAASAARSASSIRGAQRMSFLIDPKWNQNELNLHKERYELKVIMDRCYRNDPVYYQKLAKRYHEINKILGDDDYKC